MKKIFVSYSHENQDWVLPEGKYALISWLKKQLKRDDIEVWTDHALKKLPGEEYNKLIIKEITDADMAIMLISQDFVASEYIMEKEVPFIRERHTNGKIKILPLLISRITERDKKKFPWIFDLQIYPNDTQPLITKAKTPDLWQEAKIEILDGIYNRFENSNIPVLNHVHSANDDDRNAKLNLEQERLRKEREELEQLRKQLAEQKRLEEERNKIQAEKAKLEKELADQRLKTETQKTHNSQSSHTETNSNSSQDSTTPITGTINGHDYVDLGLPSGLKWATCNVGASTPSDYGNYYAWGEISTKTEYRASNSKTYEMSMGNIAGNAAYDAARANWGGKWRLPTKAEFDELKNKCTWQWTTQGGHKGYKVTGPNENSIFLPAAGYRYGTSLYYAGEDGSCWSATPYESDTQNAYGLRFDSSSHYTYWNRRYYGLSVRPVAE